MKKIYSLGAFVLSLVLITSVLFSDALRASAATAGPLNPTAAVDTAGVGSEVWASPTSIIIPGGATASANLSNSETSHYLVATNYGFSIPANAIINGIQVSINRMSSSNGGSNSVQDNDVRLVKGGTIQSASDKATNNDWPTSLGVASYGGTSDVWSNSWTPADINASNFGVALSASNQSSFSNRTASVDYMQITVTYTIDVTAPTLSQTTAVPSPTNDTTPNYTFNSSEAGTITYGGDCSSSDTTANSGANAITFNALGAGLHNNCTITITDTSLNVSSALAVNAFTIDTTAPTVTINQGGTQSDPTAMTPIVFDVEFSEPTTNFGNSDVAISGTTGGTKTATVSGSGTTYTVSVAGMTTSGTVIANINAGVATDAAGNGNIAGTFTDNSVQYDIPTHTITASAGAGGTITPAGAIGVPQGQSQTFKTVPSTGNIVSDVVVDSVSQGRIQGFTFTNVTAPHAITSSFDAGWSAPSASTNAVSMTTPDNAFTSNDAAAVFNNTSDSIDYTTFGLSIPPGATINGIQVALEHSRDVGSTRILNASLSWNAGANFSAPLAVAGANATTTTLVGGTSNLWGHAWTASELSNANFRVRAISTSGGSNLYLDQVQVKVTYTLDTTAPTGGSVSYADGYVTSASVPLTYTLGTDSGSGLNNSSGKIERASASLAGGTCDTFGAFADIVTEFDGAYTDTTVANGNCYKYQYTISDNAGNPATYTSGNVVKVDTVKPVTTIDSNSLGLLLNGLTKETAIDFTFSATDAESTVLSSECKLDADSYATCTTPYSLTSLTDGAHTLSIRSTDTAGNVESTAIFTWTVDATAPVISLSGNADESIQYGETYTDAGATANDSQDGDLTGSIITTGTVDTDTLGDYTLHYNVADTAGNDATEVTRTVHVVARAVTVTADPGQTKVYGDLEPALTYQITSGTLVLGDSFLGTLSRAGDEHVGTYEISQGTLTLGSKYALTFEGDYFEITKREVSVSADQSQTKIFGDADPVFTYEVSGDLVLGDTFSGSLTRDAGEDIGNYTILQGDLTLTSDYELTFTGATFVINPLSVTVTPTLGQSKVYGSVDPVVFTYNVVPSLASGDSFSGALSRTTGEGVGFYEITQNDLTLSTNYVLNFTPSVDFEISKAELVITAEDKTKVYGEANPTFTAIVSGFVGVDSSESDLDTPVTYSTVADETSPVGSYDIVPSADDENYDITFVDGNLSVTAAQLSVTANPQTKEYGTVSDPELTYVVTGLENGDTPESVFTGTLSRAIGEDVGSYPISVDTLDTNTNYTFDFIGDALTITQKTLTITASDDSKIFGTTKLFTGTEFTHSDLVSGDSVDSADITSTGAVSSAVVGTYPIVVVNALGSGLSNYDITYANGTLTVSKAQATVKADGKVMTYGDSEPAYTFTYVGLQNGETDIDTPPTCTAGSVHDVGAYAISCSGAVDTDYDFDYEDGNLSVDQRSIEVTATTHTKVYDSNTSATAIPTITSGSLAFSDTVNFTESYEDKNVGTGKILIPAGSVNDDNLGQNYDITFVNDVTGVITTPTALTVLNVTADNKVYDQTNTATLNLGTAQPSGFTSGDDVSVDTTGASGTFSDKNVGNDKTVTMTGFTLTGADAGNYALTQPTALASITKKTLTISATADNKVYDGNTTAVAHLSDDTISGDDVTTSYATADFADEFAGTNKEVTVLDITTGGADAGNYSANTSATTHADITVADATVSLSDLTYTYDTNTHEATVTTNPLGLSTVVTYDGGAILPQNAGSYSVHAEITDSNYSGSVDGTLVIEKADLTVTANSDSKTYDNVAYTGGNGVQYSGFVGSEDESVLDGTLSYTGDSQGATAVGTYTITPTGLTSNNYDITFQNGTLTIGSLSLEVTADSGQSKVYGATEPTLTYTITTGALAVGDSFTGELGRATGDAVGTYAIDVGTLATNGNYAFTFVGADFTITGKSLNISAAGVNKEYDATIGATVTLSDDRESGDDITAHYTTAVFDDKNVADGKTINVSGITIDGPDSGNYSVNTSAVTTANISKAPLTITAVTNTKAYDANTSAVSVPTVDGLIGSDSVTSLTETYDTASVGIGKTLSVATYTVNDGNSGNNYEVSTLTDITGVITSNAPAANNDTATVDEDSFVDIDVLVNDTDIENDTLVPSLVVSPANGSVVVNIDNTIKYTPNANFHGSDSFTYKVNDGTTDSNTATVDVTVTNTEDTALVVISNTTATYDTTGKSVTTSTTPNGLTVTLTYDGSSTLPVQAGSYAVVATINDGVYTGSSNDTLTIGKADVTVTADNKTITVGDAEPIFTFVYGAFQGSDTEAVLDTAPTCVVSGAHTAVGTYPIVCSGGADTDYAFSYTSGTLTVGEVSAPIITSENASGATSNSITVTWTTDHPATSRVVYGVTPVPSLGSPANYGYASSTVEDTNLTTNHSVTVTGLLPATTYYFRGVSHGSPETVSNEVSLVTLTANPSTGTLKVTKTAIGGGDGNFQFTGNMGGFQINTNGGTGFNELVLAPGTYTATETTQVGWTLTSNDCIDVVVVAGQVTNCSVVNTKVITSTSTTGTLIVNKIANGGDATFNFTGAGVFQITTVAGVGQNVITQVVPGTFTVTETPLAGWTMNSNTCSNIPVLAGATSTCTVTNTKNTSTSTPTTFGTLTVIKKTINGNGTFHFDGGTLGGFDIWTSWGDGSKKFKKIPTGTYSISETVPEGWTQESNSCVNVTVVKNQKVTCTIVNKKNPPAPKATIKGEKFHDRNGDGEWTNEDYAMPGWVVYLDMNNNGSWNFSEPFRITNFVGRYKFENLTPGTYHVREVNRRGWRQTYPETGVHDIELTAGAVVQDVDFGNTKSRRPQDMNRVEDMTPFSLTGEFIEEVVETPDSNTSSTTDETPEVVLPTEETPVVEEEVPPVVEEEVPPVVEETLDAPEEPQVEEEHDGGDNHWFSGWGRGWRGRH